MLISFTSKFSETKQWLVQRLKYLHIILYYDNNMLMEESKEGLKSLLMRVKVESERKELA